MFRENDTCFIISPKRDLDHEHLMAPIKVNGAIVATIGMVDLNGPFTHAQIFIANVIHDMLEKLFAIRMNKRSADDLYYFTRMLSGAEVRSRTVSLHLATKGWGMNDGFFMLSFQVSEKLDYVNKWDLCITRIQESFPRSISSVYEETIVMVIRKQDYDILQPEERKKLDDLCDSYYLRCAISSYFDQFIDLHLCYEQNRMLLNLKLQNETQLLYWPDHYEDVLKRMNAMPDVYYLDFVSRDLLLWLYQNAALFAFPSYYEGFGFPPLEAACFGTISAVSNSSSIPEVCGDSVAYFNPFSVEEMEMALEQCLFDEAFIAEKKALLIPNLDRFSWDKNAGETLKIYQSLQ